MGLRENQPEWNAMKYFKLGLIASLLAAGVSAAQAPGRPDGGRDGGRDGHAMMRHHRPRGGGRDQVALLLDKQLALQLTSQQVNQLITIHEQERQQAKPLMLRMQGLMPKDRGGWKNMTPAQRDSIGAIHEQLREIQWRQVSAAEAVLTDEQKKVAARLTSRPMWGPMGRGPMRGGPGGRADGRSDSSAGAHE
jgi:hypothetical protein